MVIVISDICHLVNAISSIEKQLLFFMSSDHPTVGRFGGVIGLLAVIRDIDLKHCFYGVKYNQIAKKVISS